MCLVFLFVSLFLIFFIRDDFGTFLKMPKIESPIREIRLPQFMDMCPFFFFCFLFQYSLLAIDFGTLGLQLGKMATSPIYICLRDHSKKSIGK